MKAILALTAVFWLASCADLPSRSSSRLLGEWQYKDKDQSCQYVFNQDGTFKGQVVYRSKLISKFVGRWSIAGDALHYTYIRDALGNIPPGAIDRDKLLSVQKEFFIIEAADGHRRKYLRVR
jgi:hypothetical protein